MSAKFPLPARPAFIPLPDNASTNADAGPSRLSPTLLTTVTATSGSEPTIDLPAAPSTPAPIPNANPNECALCPSVPKYTCPRCALRICSLPCSTAHKERFSCSGQRDASAFVPLARYTQGEWGGDYAFLEAARRQVGAWGKSVSAREVERMEEVKRVKEREERRKFREARWKEGEAERQAEAEKRVKEEQVRQARERGEVGWGRAFVPGLPGMPGAPAPALAPADNASSSTQNGTTAASSTAPPGISYAQLLDPATAVALNRANLAAEQGTAGGQGGRNAHGNNKKRPNRGGKLEAFMWEMRKRGVWVEFMPEGMERRKVNQSRWNPNSQELYITLQLVIPLDLLAATPTSASTGGPTGSDAPAPAHSTVTAAKSGANVKATSSADAAGSVAAKTKYTDTHAIFTYTHVLLHKGGGPSRGGGDGGAKAQAHASAEDGPAAPDGRAAMEESGESRVDTAIPAAFTLDPDSTSDAASKGKRAHTLPTLTSLLPPLLSSLVPSSLVFALPFHPSPARPTHDAFSPSDAASSASTTLASGKGTGKGGGKAHFQPLDASAPLAHALRGTAYVEFPTLHVHTRDAWEGMKKEGKVREVPLAEPRNKRDRDVHAQTQRGPSGGDWNKGGARPTGANGAPVSAKRAPPSHGAAGSAGQGAGSAPVDDNEPATKKSRPSGTAAALSASADPVDSAMRPVVSAASSTAASHAIPAATTKANVPVAQLGLGGLGAYGSDSEGEEDDDEGGAPEPAETEAVHPGTSITVGPEAAGDGSSMQEASTAQGADRPQEDGDLGYYDHPADDGSELLPQAAGNVQAGQDQGQGEDQEQISAESIAAEFGLSGEMLQAVGQALAADLG